MVAAEGVIKFDLRFQNSPLENSGALQELLRWRDVFHRLGAIGQDPDRYAGDAFGNISCRLGNSSSFLISGTRTGKYEKAQPGHFTCVDSCDIGKNSVIAHGPIKPSSESLTHAAVYALSPAIHCVVHGHLPQVWTRMQELNIPATPVDVPYGTPDMARSITRLFEQNGKPGQAAFGMAGHEDGIVAYAEDFATIEGLMRNKMEMIVA